MASRKIEDLHEKGLQKLLSESGVVCLRSPSLSTVEETLPEEEIEPQEVVEEAKPEQVLEEEVKVEAIEEEAHSEVFPTPSLRHALSDEARKIEAENRIHVLPDEFNTNIDPKAIPKIATTARQKYIDIVAEIVGCTKYKSSLAEYWFLDTLANLLRRAQEDEMHRDAQAVLILWFCEWMKEMQYYDAADRQRMLKKFKDNMLSAAKYIGDHKTLPTPTDAGVHYKYKDIPKSLEPELKITNDSKHQVTFDGNHYECSMGELINIIHYIFDLFSTDFQYNLVRSVFTFTPQYNNIDAPYQLQNPKRLYTPLGKGKKEKSPKAKKEKPPKVAGKGKGKEKGEVTEEFLQLMAAMNYECAMASILQEPTVGPWVSPLGDEEVRAVIHQAGTMLLKAREERELQEIEEKEREAYELKSHILPLALAVDEHFLDKYWPPPPPPSPPVMETQTESTTKTTKKGKGKKN